MRKLRALVVDDVVDMALDHRQRPGSWSAATSRWRTRRRAAPEQLRARARRRGGHGPAHEGQLDGLDVLDGRSGARTPSVPVVIMTPRSARSSARSEAMRRGAFHYVTETVRAGRAAAPAGRARLPRAGCRARERAVALQALRERT